MFGREYARYPEILIRSFGSCNDSYTTKASDLSLRRSFFPFFRLYIGVFGVPEIGFFVRALYARNAVSRLKKRNASIKRILDMGSGIGWYAMMLASSFPDARVEGWEIDDEKIDIARRVANRASFDTVSFQRRDITKTVSAKDQYDLILCVDVLEHITQYKNVLKNMHTALSHNGYLYIHVPQVMQKRIFSRMNEWAHSDHVRTGFDRLSLVHELRSLGFSVEYVRYTFGPWGKFAWELHHMVLSKSIVLSGIMFPLLAVIGFIDSLQDNQEGLCMAILAKKV